MHFFLRDASPKLQPINVMSGMLKFLEARSERDSRMLALQEREMAFREQQLLAWKEYQERVHPETTARDPQGRARDPEIVD
jgi:hypothetical protein